MNLKLIRKKRTEFIFGFCIVVVMLNCGCAAKNTQLNNNNTSAQYKALLKNVQRAWDARLELDSNTLYSLSSKGYKGKVTREMHIQRNTFKVEAYHIGNITISPDGKNAIVTVFFDVRQMGQFLKDLQLKEKWHIEAKRWVLELPLPENTPFEE